MSEWTTPTILLTMLGLLAAFVVFVVKIAVSISSSLEKNTNAIKDLTNYMEKKDAKDIEQDDRLDEHDKRFVEIDTIHRLKGCEAHIN